MTELPRDKNGNLYENRTKKITTPLKTKVKN